MSGRNQPITDKKPQPLLPRYETKPLLPVAHYLKFKRAFITVAVAIFVQQIFALVLQINYGFFEDSYPPKYYWISEISGIVWYLFMTGWILLDISEQKLSPLTLFQISITPLVLHWRRTAAYIGWAVLSVTTLTLMFPMVELGLSELLPVQRLLSFVSVVILAPVCEEIVFRGYLYPAMIPKFSDRRHRIVVNAMFFGAAHVFLVAFFIGAGVPFYIFIVGFLLATLYEHSRSILPGIILHMANNGFAFALEFFDVPGRLGIWE